MRPGRAKQMQPKKPIFIFFLILTSFSVLRLLRFLWISPPPATPEQFAKPEPHVEESLSPKEHQLLANVVSQKAPCNLLIFGFNPQFVHLATINGAGTTVFLENDAEKLRIGRSRGLRMHLLANHERASGAFELLRHARAEPACSPASAAHDDDDDRGSSGCRLALRGLPREVRETEWDAVVVDGPSGDRAEEPGRMGAIYTAAVVARKRRRLRRAAEVLVHDTDRSIEKWYSWEFLCHENLVSCKGKLWHFRIEAGNSSSERFCEDFAAQIL